MTRTACVTCLDRHRSAFRLIVLAVVLALSALFANSRAEAACTVPNQITNGQPADATVVMGNFNSLKNCVDSTVAPYGTPTAGNLPVFSSPNTITGGNISGDCATFGTLVIACTKSNGVALGHFATGTDAGQLTGTISVNRFNSGLDADSSHFLRGDGAWAIPPGGGGGATVVPTLVQAKLVIGNQPASDGIAFDTAVTPGNIIVVLATHWSNGLAAAPGWIQILNTNGVTYSGVFACMKVATEADAGVLIKPFLGGTGGQSLAMFEVKDAPAVPTIAIAHIQELNTATPVLKGAAVRDNSLVIGIASTELSNVAPTGLNGAVTTGQIQGVAASASPRHLMAFKRDSATKGVANVAITYPAAAIRSGLIVAIPPQ